ncbi:MAG: DUF2752 domain-containing protein [Verrucomicrobiota bacterium]
MSSAPSHRNAAVLVAPVVTFCAVVLMLIGARLYERLPIQLRECGFRERTGIPCLSCGGTRSMQALSQGKVKTAIFFHPAFALGVLLSPLWLAVGIHRYRRGKSVPEVREQNRRMKAAFLVVAGILLINWVYLIFFLP